MQHSPSWEANRFFATEQIPRILWNPKFHYRIHTCTPTVPILSQFYPVHVPTPHFLNIHLKIILPSTLEYPKWYLSLRFPHQTPVYASPLTHTRYTPHPSHSSLFNHPHNIWWAIQIFQLLIMQLPPSPCHLVPLRLKYSPQHPILKHPQPALLPSC